MKHRITESKKLKVGSKKWKRVNSLPDMAAESSPDKPVQPKIGKEEPLVGGISWE
jgi:hypothetical protein